MYRMRWNLFTNIALLPVKFSFSVFKNVCLRICGMPVSVFVSGDFWEDGCVHIGYKNTIMCRTIVPNKECVMC